MGSILGENRSELVDIWYAGVNRVKGERAVTEALQAEGPGEISHLLAVGKAAASMVRGCKNKLSRGARILTITKYDHAEGLAMECDLEVIESAHPIPDENSLRAGNMAIEFVESVCAGEEMVVLVSGGASALVESLKGDLTLDDLRSVTESLVSASYSIDQINAVRTRLSNIKGGQLVTRFKGTQVRTYAISDVPTDDVRIIGSGIGADSAYSEIDFTLPKSVQSLIEVLPSKPNPQSRNFVYQERIIASNSLARMACASKSEMLGYTVQINSDGLNHNVEQVAKNVGHSLRSGAPGIYIWGGEPTVDLPENPGEGGRNQHLALSIAREIAVLEGVTVLVGGTDGTDGPTDAAGGIVDGNTFDEAGESALAMADSGTYLKDKESLFKTGPTGTNVMDLVVAVKA